MNASLEEVQGVKSQLTAYAKLFRVTQIESDLQYYQKKNDSEVIEEELKDMIKDLEKSALSKQSLKEANEVEKDIRELLAFRMNQCVLKQDYDSQRTKSLKDFKDQNEEINELR